MIKVEYLIIGQGLAGSNLAFHLLNENKSVLIVDKHRKNTSSKVAAGLMNPVTGRRFAKTWLAEKIFPYAKSFYKDKEQLLKGNFYHEVSIHRYFGSIEDQNTWMGRSSDNEIKPYIGHFSEENTKGIQNTFGGAEILNGGWLDTNVFLELSRKYFIENDCLIDDDFTISSLKKDTKKIEWNDIQVENIIFCEGYRAKDNPYFDWLPFTFAKGEVLDIKMEGISKDVIHNKNGFILHTSDDNFKVGATFRWNEMNEEPTERSLNELKEKLTKITSNDYYIIDQKASIRPTTKDRRPFIGHNQQHKNIFIFNGFGSKGVTLTPYLANNFTSFLLGKSPLLDEVNINRFLT